MRERRACDSLTHFQGGELYLFLRMNSLYRFPKSLLVWCNTSFVRGCVPIGYSNCQVCTSTCHRRRRLPRLYTQSSETGRRRITITRLVCSLWEGVVRTPDKGLHCKAWSDHGHQLGVARCMRRSRVIHQVQLIT